MILLDDQHGDEIRVFVDDDQVSLHVTDATLKNHPLDCDFASALLDPDDADELAEALTKAATRARAKRDAAMT